MKFQQKNNSFIIILFIIASFIIFKFREASNRIIFINTKDEILTHILPSLDTVILNKNTLIFYEKKFTSKEVTIDKGEAFFKQKVGNYLKVRMKNSFIISNESNFNLKIKKDGVFLLSCLSGKLKVDRENVGGQSVVLLKKSEQVYVDPNDDLVAPSPIKHQNTIAWLTGVLVFYETPLGAVCQTLEDYFGMSIGFSNELLKNCPISGTFPIKNPDKILSSMTFSKNWKIIQVNNSYKANSWLIRGEKCF